jgi:thiamine biosynthesis lipoprotein
MLFAVLLTGCAKSSTPTRYEQVYLDVFDTVTTIVVYDTSEKHANDIIEQIHQDLLTYHQLYDIYNTYDGINNLATVNANAGIAPVKVDKKILDLIDYAISMDELTNGRMNIAMGSVLTIWKTYRDAGTENPDAAQLPPMDALKAANEHALVSNIVIDRAAGTLYITDPQTQIDVGAIGKGYAGQQIIQAMKEAGVTNLLLSIGGNVCSIGSRIDGTGWKVGIQDPYSDANLCVVAVSGQNVVTSGTYERYYTVDGKRYHHIIDPSTLMPSVLYDSVTVISSDSGLADALTTGLFCMPIDEGMALIEKLPDTEALWVLSDGTQRQSSGFSAYIIQE